MTGRYYTGNADMGALEFYRCIRGHRPIENRLHRSPDVIFLEDASLAGKGHAPENLNILRKTALSLLRAAGTPKSQSKRKMTGPGKRFVAPLNPGYMFTVFFGK
jgi:predicted transposase YbfD/YdcC